MTAQVQQMGVFTGILHINCEARYTVDIGEGGGFSDGVIQNIAAPPPFSGCYIFFFVQQFFWGTLLKMLCPGQLKIFNSLLSGYYSFLCNLVGTSKYVASGKIVFSPAPALFYDTPLPVLIVFMSNLYALYMHINTNRPLVMLPLV